MTNLICFLIVHEDELNGKICWGYILMNHDFRGLFCLPILMTNITECEDLHGLRLFHRNSIT